MGRSFNATMEYLMNEGIIHNQLDLAALLGVTPSSVSGMKSRNAINDTRLVVAAEKIAKDSSKDPKEIFENLIKNIPEAFSYSKAVKSDFCTPSREDYDAFLGTIPTSKVRFSDTVAINKESAKDFGGAGNIIYMTYLKTNLMNSIHPNDVLVVKSTDKKEGDGYYIIDCESDVRVDYLDSTEKDINKERDASDRNNYGLVGNIIGRVVGIYRAM